MMNGGGREGLCVLADLVLEMRLSDEPMASDRNAALVFRAAEPSSCEPCQPQIWQGGVCVGGGGGCRPVCVGGW